MSWCESNDLGYVPGLAKNARLIRAIGAELHQTRELFEATGMALRVFRDFQYWTKKTGSRQRRVIGRAGHPAKGTNPRFVVTSISAQEFAAQVLYETGYCARGEMENRIKEQQAAMCWATRCARSA